MSERPAIDGLPPLRTVIDTHGLAARKTLGQNFLLDLNLTGKIARQAGDLTGTTVIEVGPGPGGLTRALLMEGAARVIAIERDSRCLPALEEIAAHYHDRLAVIEADALTVDYAALSAGSERTVIVANLPYNVGTELLVGWLTAEPWLSPSCCWRPILVRRSGRQTLLYRPGSKWQRR